MSELIFQKDSYEKEFDCNIVEIDEGENAVVLDRTAFYPGGGGQLCDKGVLIVEGETYTVEKVKKNGEKIYHCIEGSLPKLNTRCKGQIDWEYRYKLMRTHTAMHILCGIVWRDYKAQVTGGNMEPLQGRMDFEFENLEKDLIKEIEEKVNQEVENKRNVKVNILKREEAFQIPDLIRTKINLLPEGIEEIRTVEIEGLDLQADGGTHVKNTREVGKINIIKYKSKGKVNKRIYVEIED
ncbi:alanyl-tRNA editing protein [Marinisporobacter balticus]|uniref:Misacylated tRNA(Ala) deacylase n=1 Tax=Marinisporobacter balticus TaxID=2018667 RepID=A0A4R2L5M1_9FIRM|nr:alanyl-tRNA editing protein [Marinisporobacter balticus]TCO79339.1 misacylated tRNA(Ala) deacylase [Marinisporobacter balticus]